MKNAYEIAGDKVLIRLERKGAEDLTTIIDLKDFEIANAITGNWRPYWGKTSKSYYVVTKTKVEGKPKTVLLHRWLMNAPVGYVVDHINHDTLDNRSSSNLRLVSHSENLLNRKQAASHNKTGIRGVHWIEGKKKYRAIIFIGKNKKTSRYYTDIHEAEIAAKESREKYLTI